MKRPVPLALCAIGAALLLWNLGRPALWQDEAETALRAESILATGLPRTTLAGVVVTAQPSLVAHEGNAEGVWTWNTWLPAYVCAASFAALGATAFAARLPFALAGLLALWLALGLFEGGEADLPASERRAWAPEAALALLALSPAYVLFCRQSRYYALVALGSVAALRAWRRLLAGRPYGPLALALALNFLLHASFAFFAAAALALALDAALRGRECAGAPRYWAAAGLTLALAAPAAWYFRVWDRPGNHLYGFGESLQFLKTFLLWLCAFGVPALAFAGRPLSTAAGFALLCGLVAEGPLSAACGVAVWLGVLVAAGAQRPRLDGLNLSRAGLLFIAATLGLLAFGAAEPYGRYLAGILPVCAYLSARGLSRLARGRPAAVAGLTAACVSCNLLFLAPLKAAQAFAAPRAPADTVSGMMRQRLRDLPPRSDLYLCAREIFRGPEGYVESAVAAIRAGGGKTFFSDADELSLMFAAPLRPMYPDEFLRAEPDWILPSPWLGLTPDLEARARALVASGRYAPAAVTAPRLMWQNNPDPLFRDFSPARGPLALFRKKDRIGP